MSINKNDYDNGCRMIVIMVALLLSLRSKRCFHDGCVIAFTLLSRWLRYCFHDAAKIAAIMAAMMAAALIS